MSQAPAPRTAQNEGTTMPEPIASITERIALFVSSTGVETGWAELDSSGAPPLTLNSHERVTSSDAAVAVYRAPALPRSAYLQLQEIVRIAACIAPAEEAHREQMQALRDDLAVSYQAHATEQDLRDRAEHRFEQVIIEARRWKARALAAETEADTLHAALTSAETRARIATSDRDLLEVKLDVAITNERQATSERNEANARAVEAQANALNVIARISQAIPAPAEQANAEAPALEISTFFAPDNTPVVQIDSQLISGRLRVNLNDAPIWDGDPEHDEYPGSNAEPLEHEQPEPVTKITRAEIREITVTQDRDGAGFISIEVGAVDSAAVFANVDFPVPEECGHDSRDAERLEMRRNLCDDHLATIGGHQKTISRQLDTIREQADTIDRLRGERTSEEQRADSAEEQVRLNSNALESVQAELNEARAAQQVSAQAGHEYGKRIWAIVREAAGVEGDPIPTIKELREQRDAAIHLAEARQDARDADQQQHERQVADLTAERDAARRAVAACQNRLAAAEQRSTAWQRVLDHPAMEHALDDDNMTANQAVGYRLTELANIEQKWNARNAAAVPDYMPPTTQDF